MHSTTVLKLGSSVLRSDSGLPLAVHEIYREWRAGRRVLAVVSDLGSTSDDLLKRAQQLGLPPQREGLAALLKLALDRSGIPAVLLDPVQISLLTLESESAVVVVSGSDRTARFLTRELRGSCRPLLDAPLQPRPPLRVALLGCGTVGGGVLARLLARPDLFRLTGVAVRDRGRVRTPAVPRRLLTEDPAALLARGADVVVELLGGLDPARELIAQTLERGRHVVTANKALLAREVENLSNLAAARNVSLRYSASVGGALPALEAVRRVASTGRIRAVSGVLNGTCNFVLDRCAAGASFTEAVSQARDEGYAEADPTLDLDGSDAAQKLSLLAREAFGEALPWASIPRQGIDALAGRAVSDAAGRGRVVRLVASCERTDAGLRASVQPLDLPPDHPFARASGAGNALGIELEGGDLIRINARGAGRWPTTEAVLADLYDLAAESIPVARDRGIRKGAA